MCDCYEDILMEKKRSLSHKSSVLDLVKASYATYASPPLLLNIGGDNLDDPRESASSLNCHLFVKFHIFLKSFHQ
jgi:hypothetical protein